LALIPDFETFARGWAEGQNQLVYARLAADLDTPVSLMLKLTEARTDSFMLESVTGGEVRGRYSVVGMKPDLIWRCHGPQAQINREARFDATAFQPHGRPAAGHIARADRRIPYRNAQRPAAHRGGPVRLSGL
jgi:anthranilate synthase component I